MSEVQIYDKETGEIVETLEVYELRSFLAYWDSQCDAARYGWRLVSGGDD